MLSNEADIIRRLALGLSHEMRVDVPKPGHQVGHCHIAMRRRDVFLGQVLLFPNPRDDLVLNDQRTLRNRFASTRNQEVGLHDGVEVLLLRGHVVLGGRYGAGANSDAGTCQEETATARMILVVGVCRRGLDGC
jgi:hypothetical protein